VSDSRRSNDRSSGFKSVKQVGLAVSIGFPLVVIGVLMFTIFLFSLVGTATALWILAGVILGLGLLGALSRRVV
jgi:hypothetical protein